MGWDHISFGQESELFKDSDLWVLRHFLVEQARLMKTTDPSQNISMLREFFERWDWLGPGVFAGTDFSTYVMNHQARWELLLKLLQFTGDRISEFGETIPSEYLNSHTNRESLVRFMSPVPTEHYLVGIGRMCSLLGKHEPRLQTEK
jgi:hypothetical protein